MVSIQQQAQALGDPTRHGVFRYVVDAAEPITVAELTEQFGLNHNAIRQHLAKLVAAELLVEERGSSVRPGRPPLLYSVDPRAESQWGVTGPYERLAGMLTEIIRSGDTPVVVGRRVGRRRHLGNPTDEDPVGVLVDSMARHGFDPVLKRTGRKVEVVLRSCPYLTTALADPDTVCEMHLGIAQGIAERTDGLVIDELIPMDPRRANCRLRCHVAAGAESAP
jgi:predicted ArsR family transcriptional regulator